MDYDSSSNFASQHTVLMLFAVHDYGLENCAISSLFPMKSRLQPQKNYVAEGHTESLEVWSLDEPTRPWSPLDQPTAYSWSTRPARRRLLGALNASATRDHTPSFHCESQTTFMVELTCSNPNCRLEYIQDRAAPRFGKLRIKIMHRFTDMFCVKASGCSKVKMQDNDDGDGCSCTNL